MTTAATASDSGINTGFMEPDLDFISRLKQMGGENLKKCYQCATCTAVCDVTPKNKPFPRKEMIWAQWGQKEKLMYNPAIWLCHQCGDCSAHCPRGARPSDLMSAVRSISYSELAVPKFMGKMLARPIFLVPLFAIPIALILFLAVIVNGLPSLGGEIIYSKFMPIAFVDSIFIPVFLFAGAISLFTVMNFWKGMQRNDPDPNPPGFIPALIGSLTDILLHKNFRKCKVNKPLHISHFLTMFGFIALLITTGFVGIYYYLFSISTPLSLQDPIKILGNIGAVMTFTGVSWIVLRRITSKDNAGKASYVDWVFIITLFLTIITGIGSEMARLRALPLQAYSVYFIHLVLVFFLLAYLPFSKFAHLLYRTTAMVYARAMEKNAGNQPQEKNGN